MADNENAAANDAADERQTRPRQGIPGKGFDAGTGYGGAGNDSLYSGESSYGGQSGSGGSALGGAYRGDGYGRAGEDQDPSQDPGGDNVLRDTDGRGSENLRADLPRDPDVEAVTDAFEGSGRIDTPASGTSRDGPDAIDLKDMSGATRRDPGH